MARDKQRSRMKTKDPSPSPRSKETSSEAENDDEEQEFHVLEESSSSEDESSSDEELALDGVLEADDDDDDDEDSSSSSSSSNEEELPVRKRRKIEERSKSEKNSIVKKKKKKKELLQVEFLFCDVEAKFFHGIKTLLAFEPAYASQSSQLADAMIHSIAGTVLTTEDDDVFAVASVIDFRSTPPEFKEICLRHCPSQHKSKLESLLSSKTTGLMIHVRVINVPLTIVEAVHQQFVLDMDWAASSDKKKKENFEVYLILAPCDGSLGSPTYKYFEDEIFASNAEFVFTFDGCSSSSQQARRNNNLCSVIVLTKPKHRASMSEIAKFIPR